MSIYTDRIKKLAKKLNVGDSAILFAGTAPVSTADSHYRMRTNKNFFYLTGLKCEDYRLAVTKTSSGVSTRLFIERPNYDIEKWVGRKLRKEQATEISGIDEVDYVDGFHNWLAAQIQTGAVERVLLDVARLRWNDPTRVEEEFARTVQHKYPHVQIGSIHTALAELRVLKDKHEIAEMQKAVDITEQAIRKLYETVQPGMKEYEVEAEFAYQVRKQGGDGISFETIAAAGGNATILHYVDNDMEMRADQLILLDLGAQYREYAADISRTIPVGGKFSERQKQIYEIVLKAQSDVLEVMKPGTKFSELNKTCRESLLKSLKKIGLAKTDEELSKYYFHGVSHYLGLDVHDVGARDVVLEPGMVLTVEPGLYIAEEEIGIRIEDDVLITAKGNEVLSRAIPKTVAELEALMAGKVQTPQKKASGSKVKTATKTAAKVKSKK